MCSNFPEKSAVMASNKLTCAEPIQSDSAAKIIADRKRTGSSHRALFFVFRIEDICDMFIAFIPFFIRFVVEKLLGKYVEPAAFDS